MGISGQVRGQDPSDSAGNTVCRGIIMDLCHRPGYEFGLCWAILGQIYYVYELQLFATP